MPSPDLHQRGICSGKKTVAQYLVDHHGFTHLYLQHRPEVNGVEKHGSEQLLIENFSGQENGLHKETGSPSHASLPLRTALKTTTHTFPTAGDLLNFVTKRWRERWVTTDIHDESILDVFIRRPFFILISVDAPVTVRWRRFQKRQREFLAQDGTAKIHDPVSLEDFVTKSDNHLYDPHSGLQPLISRATVRLLNTSTSLAHLYATLGKLNLANPDRLRPSWDIYFMSLASLAAQRSNCMKRRVGCVLVGREKRVISTGYNGTPRGITNCAEGGCGRCNAGNSSGVGLSTCLCIHAEENALLEAGRERIREGAVLYCDTCPCLTCSIKICQVGISEVVYSEGYSMDEQAAMVFREAGVRLRQFIPVSIRLMRLQLLWHLLLTFILATKRAYPSGEDGAILIPRGQDGMLVRMETTGL